jgi:hypothetical protein
MTGIGDRQPLAFLVCRVSFLLLDTLSGMCLAAFGFLPGKEVKKAKIGNLGLQDREFKLADLRTGHDIHPPEKNVSP